MKVCIASNQGGLEDSICPIFGRCPSFTIVDVENGEIQNVEVRKNQHAQAAGGAGIQAAQFVANQGSEACIAGNFGPNAYRVLARAGVQAYAAEGNIEEIVSAYLNNQLTPVNQPTARAHRGMRGRGFMQSGPETSPENREKQVEHLEGKLEGLEEEMQSVKEELRKLREEEQED